MAVMPLVYAAGAQAAASAAAPAQWDTYQSISTLTPNGMVGTGDVLDSGTLGASGATAARRLDRLVGATKVSVGGAPAPFAAADARAFYANTIVEAGSELVYEWRFTSADAIDLAVFAPTVTIDGYTFLAKAAGRSNSYGAIDTAALFFDQDDAIEGGAGTPDTGTGFYREIFHGCGISPSDVCGQSDFSLRGMYSQIDDYTIGGYLMLRAFARVDIDGIAATQISQALIDPIISFDDQFLALHPDFELTLSPGLVNATLAPSPVPGPATWLTMLAGFAMIGMVRSRRNRRPVGLTAIA